MPKQDPVKSKKFRVLHSQVGPFPKGHVFTREEFERLHKLPKAPTDGSSDPVENRDTYHDDAVKRLLDLKAVEPVDEETPADKTPPGPENRPEPAAKHEPAPAEKQPAQQQPAAPQPQGQQGKK